MPHHHTLVLSLIIIISGVFIKAEPVALGGSTSPYVIDAGIQANQQTQQDSGVITFSEFPVDTYITDQYSNRGVIFMGDSPFIADDGSNPTSPVLSGTPRFEGAIEGRFVNPYNGVTPITVSSFSLDAGYFNELGTTRIEWFDRNDNKLGEQTSSVIGIEHFIIEGSSISRWRISMITSDTSGFDIDNIEIGFDGWLEFTKSDDVNDGDCVRSGREITYTITYDFNSISDSNVAVIDYLPTEVNYNSSSPAGDYNASDGTVRWNLGTVSASGQLNLFVTVKNSATPGRDFVNIAEIQGDSSFGYAEVSTFVCYTGEVNENVIYVDKDANDGLNNGSSWDNAYIDFNDALARAPQYIRDLGNCEIWVAAGTYKPKYDPDYYYAATFLIPAGNIAIRGHFGGKGRYETSPDQRDFNNAAYETIFDGLVGSWEQANYVVTCDDIGAGLLLDGFTITGAADTGLYIDNYSDPSITTCKFTGNAQYGIYAYNYSYPDVTDCRFLENGTGPVTAGIYSENSSWPYIKDCVFDGNNNNYYGVWGKYSEMTIEDCIFKRQSSYGVRFENSYLTLNRCKIENNTGSGIYCTNTNLEVANCTIQGNGNGGIEAADASVPTIANNIICDNKHYGIYTNHCENITIKNNSIHHNGDGGTNSGLNLQNSISPPIVRNNTIVGNTPYGIYVDYGRDPCLINDIVYSNGTEPNKNIYSVRGIENVVANYCCIGGGFEGTDNISCDPCFRNPDVNDFHLKEDSNCIDAGDPSLDYEGETDIDGHCRVMFGKSDMRVDISADEFSPKADYNGDLIVNFVDFANLASTWQQPDPNKSSLDDDNDVDIYDLEKFCDNWLWIAPCSQMYQLLTEQPEDDLGMSAGSGTLAMSIIESSASNVQTVVPAAAEESATTEPMTSEPATVEEPVDNQQQSMLDNEGETAGIWMVYDGNMTPNYGDEITVYIHSDPMLFCMGTVIEVAGDANITTAMGEADCNNYGWDNGWDSDPYIDPAGWVSISGVSWEGTVNGTVGYFKFR